MTLPPSETPRQEPTHGSLTTVAAGAMLRGRLRGRGFILVEGGLHGEVELEGEIVVGRGGRLEGDPLARADLIRVEGRTAGALEARQRLEALDGSLLEGEVRAPSARLDPGARSRARLRLGSAPAPSPSRTGRTEE